MYIIWAVLEQGLNTSWWMQTEFGSGTCIHNDRVGPAIRSAVATW